MTKHLDELTVSELLEEYNSAIKSGDFTGTFDIFRELVGSGRIEVEQLIEVDHLPSWATENE